MLCKTTMRAALAHVLGTVGIVGAFGAGAAPADPYAAESLTGKSPYTITATPMGEIVLDTEIDTLLEGDKDFYLVVTFDAQLTGEIPLTYTHLQDDPDGDEVGEAGEAGVDADPANNVTAVKTVQPEVGDGTGFRFYNVVESVRAATGVTAVDGQVLSCAQTPGQDPGGNALSPALSDPVANNPCTAEITLTRAYRGDETDSSGVYKISTAADTQNIPIDTRVRVALGNGALAIKSTGARKYKGNLYIYEELGDARAAARGSAPDTYLVHAEQDLFEVKSKIAKPTVMGHLATADVGYDRPSQVDAKDNVLVTNGGPFRGFVASAPTTKNVGVLATITLNHIEDRDPKKAGVQGFLNAANGGGYTADPNTGAAIAVTAAAGAFGFGNGAGTGRKGEVALTGDDPGTDKVEDADHVYHKGGAPKAFMASTSTACGNNPLTLQVPGATADSWVAIDPNARDNATFSAQATRGSVTVKGNGTFYLCVLVSENEVEIPAVGDDRDMDGYKINVTPLHGTAKGPALSGGNGGAIDRNGTTVNITYLSVHPAYNQRLVIVNRGSREAAYWMNEFQTESGTTVTSELEGTVAAKSRMVIRVQDALAVNADGMSRASGTLNLTAPEADIDVMTLQVHPGTGQIDTTTY